MGCWLGFGGLAWIRGFGLGVGFGGFRFVGLG